jgi:acyl-CoA synthetase (NDP forming)
MSAILDKFHRLFYPSSVAVVGASNKLGKWGFGIFTNLKNRGYQEHGKLFPINPGEKTVQEIPAFPSLLDVPEGIDLVVIVVPPRHVIPVIRQCRQKKAGAIVVITAGFAEVDQAGAKLQEEMVKEIKGSDMILIGPNCQGIMNSELRLYAQIPWFTPAKGPISMVCQSGNIGDSFLYRGTRHGIGFNKWVSSGNEAATDTLDLLEYFREDPGTRAIITYIEGIKDGARFLNLVRTISREKPIVAIKGGVSDVGGRAALSHTGALAGSAEIFRAACRQVGVIVAETMDDAYYTAANLIAQPRPRGPRVAISSIGGGFGVMAADYCASLGLEVVPLLPETLKALNHILPSRWSHGNPVDPSVPDSTDMVVRALAALAQAENVDAIIHFGLGQAGWSKIEAIRELDRSLAQGILDVIEKYQKPVYCASDLILGARAKGNASFELLAQKNIPVMPDTCQAAQTMAHICEYQRYLENQS